MPRSGKMFLFQSTRPIRGSKKDKGQRTRQLFRHARHLEAKSSIESEDYFMISPEEKAGDSRILKKK